MMCAEQAGLLVLVTDRAEVAADDLKVGVLADVVLGHFEHAEVEVCYGAEGAACDEDERLLLGVSEDSGETVGGELVIWRVREHPRRGW